MLSSVLEHEARINKAGDKIYKEKFRHFTIKPIDMNMVEGVETSTGKKWFLQRTWISEKALKEMDTTWTGWCRIKI